MSDIARLKGQLNSLASDTKSTANNLSGFTARFGQAVGRVQSTIGGTSTRTDANIIQTLKAAENQVKAASQALQQASTALQRYSAQL